MRQTLSIGLALLMAIQAGPAAFGEDNVAHQLASMPAGTIIDVQLKSKETLRGTKGNASSSGFTLRNPTVGDRQVAFDDITSVKRLNQKSHTIRNVLIVVGIAVVVVVTVLAIHIKNHPLG